MFGAFFYFFGDIRDYATECFSDDLHSSGFFEKNLKTKNGLQFKDHWKNPVELLSERVAITGRKDLITKYVPLPFYTHLLNIMNGRDMVTPIEKFIKKSVDKEMH